MASPPPDGGPRRSSRPKRTITVAESDEENDIPKPAPKKTKAQRAKEAKDVVVVSDEDEEEAFSPDVLDALKGDSDEEGIKDDDSPPPKNIKGKKAAPKATAKKEKAPPKPRKKKEVTPETESEDDEADGPTLKLGDKLPSIKLKNEDGELVDVSTLVGEKGVVFFLYPKADTPGCTNQACGFRDMYAEIAAYDYEVYGLSKDLPTAQQKWKAKKNLNYHLLSDPKSKLIEKLGAFVPPKNTKRSHFIFEKGTGELIDAEIGVRPAEDPNNVLAFLTEKYD